MMSTSKRYMIHSAIIFVIALFITVILGIVQLQYADVLMTLNITVLILALSGILFILFYFYNRFYAKEL